MPDPSKHPYKSGFCIAGNHALCKGEIRNGPAAPKPILHCACTCHPTIEGAT